MWSYNDTTSKKGRRVNHQTLSQEGNDKKQQYCRQLCFVIGLSTGASTGEQRPYPAKYPKVVNMEPQLTGIFLEGLGVTRTTSCTAHVLSDALEKIQIVAILPEITGLYLYMHPTSLKYVKY